MDRDAARLPKQSFTIEEVIAVTGWNRNRFFTLVTEGRLKTFKHGRRRFVSAKALDQCISDLEAETAARELL